MVEVCLGALVIAARVLYGKPGEPSPTHMRCLEEVQAISSATLFSPVTRCEVVQALGEVLISIPTWWHV
jgi:hypothetical protein